MRGLMFERTARFRVDRDFETDALTSWLAPYTGSEYCVIPAGTILLLDRDVEEPTQQVRYELIDPQEGQAYISTDFPAAFKMGFGDVAEQPDKWNEVIYLTSGLSCYAEDHKELEAQLIPEPTRTAPKYGGYWFWLPLTAIGSGIEFISEEHEIAIRGDSRLYVKEPFDCFGLRSDGIAVRCRVPAEVLLVPRHAIEKRHNVSGWEMTHEDFTWWRSDNPAGKYDESVWMAAERVCPSRFLANCDPRFAGTVEADREWDALLVPTDFLDHALALA